MVDTEDETDFSEKWIVMIKEYDDKGNYRCIPRKRKIQLKKL